MCPASATYPPPLPRIISKSCSGTVYKVKLHGETCAAKEVNLGRSVAAQENFVKEAERLHQLRHANIVSLYGVVRGGGWGGQGAAADGRQHLRRERALTSLPPDARCRRPSFVPPPRRRSRCRAAAASC